MIRPGSRRHSSTVHLFRRLSTSNDLARRRATLDNRLVDQSAPRNAVYARRNRSTEFVTLSIAAQRASQPTSPRERTPKSP